MNNSQRVYELGQALWYDNIQRRMLENGELAWMIDEGLIYGVTSNPSIFNNAIGKSADYDAALAPLAAAGKPPKEIFEALAVADIQQACDLFLPLYKESSSTNGYVSMEVDPRLAQDTGGTLREARALWEMVARPNLMVKIPATKAGLPAVRAAIAAGINVNITLIFSCNRYLEVMDAYLAGLEERRAGGRDITTIASVASFFISRIDSRTDMLLEERVQAGNAAAAALLGKTAIANAKIAYQEFKRMFDSERFRALAEAGGRVQRPLWASTSTKNPAYPDTLYVDALIGPDTVNTVPPETLTAFNQHGKAEPTLEAGLAEAQIHLVQLAEHGIVLDEITEWLEKDGVEKFSDAFSELLETVRQRSALAS